MSNFILATIFESGNQEQSTSPVLLNKDGINVILPYQLSNKHLTQVTMDSNQRIIVNMPFEQFVLNFFTPIDDHITGKYEDEYE